MILLVGTIDELDSPSLAGGESAILIVAFGLNRNRLIGV